MASLHSIFQDIALIISTNSDAYILRDRIRNKTFDWEKIVPVASKHLIIPLIYYKLKDKNVLHLLLEDLRSYLTEIARQNTERNKTILEEIKDLSLLLNAKNIDHVFLKGAAMLASGRYLYIGERMIGDIDILVKSDQLLKTQQIFLKNGYSEAERSLTDTYFEQKHLPRLRPENKLAAIEIHGRILQKPINDVLRPESVLSNKAFNNDIYVPDNSDLFLHCILNFEINDLGYYYNYLGLRNTYDALVIMNHLTESQISDSLNTKNSRSFFNKVTCYFNCGQLVSNYTKNSFKRRVFLLKQKNKSLNKAYFFALNYLDVIALILNRFYLFSSNSSYRRDSFRKRKKILKFIKSRLQIQ